ncbi:MAG: tetratricopeptide repeat protein, partial [Pseudomonadota bacterium]
KAAPNVVSHERLVDAVWGGRVVSPETATQRVKLLRQALGDDAADPRYVGLVRGSGYALLPPVEVLPLEDIKPATTLPSEWNRRRFLPLGIVLLLGVVGATYFVQSSNKTSQQPSAGSDQKVLEPYTVAVLPFANQSANEDDLYLSNGISDDLRDQLGKMSGLRVAARTSSVSFASDTTDALTIAERLRVSKLVEGRWWREGDVVRISVNIVDGASGFSEWSSEYSYSSTGLLGIQEQLSNEVVAQLLPDLDAAEPTYDPATLDASANELMLLARHYFHQVQESSVVDLETLGKAIDLYAQAIEIDPESAEAHARLGAALLYLGDVEAAEDPIFAALTLDPTLSEAHNTLGLLYWMRFEEGSGEEHWRAIELNPNNADALENYGKWLWHQQETDKVLPYFQRALELDAMSLQRYLDLGHLYGISNRRDEALQIASQIQSRFNDVESLMALARIHELTGDLDRAIAWALEALEQAPHEPDKAWLVAELYARIGMFETANDYEAIDSSFNLLYWSRDYERMIDVGEERVLDQPNQVQIWYGLGRAYVATGQYEQAAHVLRRQNLPHAALVDSRRANGLEALVTLADALKESGAVTLAQEYAAQTQPRFANLRETGAGDSWWPNLYEACSWSILDEDEKALEALERVKGSDGLLWYPMLVDAPCFRRYHDNDTYLDVIEHFEARLTASRQKLPDTLRRFEATIGNQARPIQSGN